MQTEIFQPLTRIALFYDGSYFMKTSQYFQSTHVRRAYLTFTGFQEYVRHKVAEKEHRDVAFCQIVEAHFFAAGFRFLRRSRRTLSRRTALSTSFSCMQAL